MPGRASDASGGLPHRTPDARGRIPEAYRPLGSGLRLANNAAWTVAAGLARDQDLRARTAWTDWHGRSAGVGVRAARPNARSAAARFILQSRDYQRRRADLCVDSDLGERSAVPRHDHLDLPRRRDPQTTAGHA